MGKRNTFKVNINKFISIEDAFSEFILEKEGLNTSPKTIHNYKQSVGYFVDDEFLGDYTTNIAEVSRIYVEQWKVTMLDKGKRPTTINHYLRDLRVFLYWCMDDERKFIDPSFKIECVKGQAPMPKIYTDEEVEILLQKPTNIYDQFEWRNWGIVNWVIGTGHRASTICELRLGDIDFINKEISLRHTKSKRLQTTPLTPELEKQIKLYIKTCRDECDENDFLFPNIQNKQLTPTALAHSFAKYCKRRGVEKTNIHGLRHYFGTSLARVGYNGDKIQALLGHSTYSTTQIYINISSKDLKDDFASVSPLDKIKRSDSRSPQFKTKKP